MTFLFFAGVSVDGLGPTIPGIVVRGVDACMWVPSRSEGSKLELGSLARISLVFRGSVSSR